MIATKKKKTKTKKKRKEQTDLFFSSPTWEASPGSCRRTISKGVDSIKEALKDPEILDVFQLVIVVFVLKLS